MWPKKIYSAPPAEGVYTITELVEGDKLLIDKTEVYYYLEGGEVVHVPKNSIWSETIRKDRIQSRLDPTQSVLCVMSEGVTYCCFLLENNKKLKPKENRKVLQDKMFRTPPVIQVMGLSTSALPEFSKIHPKQKMKGVVYIPYTSNSVVYIKKALP